MCERHLLLLHTQHIFNIHGIIFGSLRRSEVSVLRSEINEEIISKYLQRAKAVLLVLYHLLEKTWVLIVQQILGINLKTSCDF